MGTTLADLFKDGTIGIQEEAAIEELRIVRSAVGAGAWDGGALGSERVWQRYGRWRRAYRGSALSRSPSRPWGLSWAALALELICEPVGFDAMARDMGIEPRRLVRLFVEMVRSYGMIDERTADGGLTVEWSTFRFRPQRGRRRARSTPGGSRVSDGPKMPATDAPRGLSVDFRGRGTLRLPDRAKARAEDLEPA